MKTLKSNLLLTALVLLTSLMATASFAQNADGEYTETIMVNESFSGIEADGVQNITLIPGTVQSVRAVGNQPLAGKVEVEVNGGTLEIDLDGVEDPQRVKFYVTFVQLTKIEASGASNIKSEGLIKAEKFEIEFSGATKVELQLEVQNLVSEISGAANVKLTGTCNYHNLEASGAGKLSAYDLETTKANVEVTGAASTRLNVLEQVNGEASGVGKIMFKKEPKIRNIDQSGVSKIYTGDEEVASSNGDQTVIVGNKTLTIKSDGVIIESDSSNVDPLIINDDGVKMVIQEKTDGDKTESRVLVINDEGVKIVNKSGKKDKDIFKRNKNKFNGHWEGLCLGVNGYLNSEGTMDMPKGYDLMDLRMEKSINVQLNFFEQNVNIIRNHFGLVTGLGLEYNNYRFDNKVRLDPDVAPIKAFEDTVHSSSKSKLVVNWLTLPIMFEYQTNAHSKLNSFHIAAGMNFGVRWGSHTKYVYTNGKENKDKDFDNFNLNPFKYDAMVRIGWGVLNLYGTYAIGEMFKAGKGPELYPFSVGFALVGM